MCRSKEDRLKDLKGKIIEMESINYKNETIGICSLVSNKVQQISFNPLGFHIIFFFLVPFRIRSPFRLLPFSLFLPRSDFLSPPPVRF